MNGYQCDVNQESRWGKQHQNGVKHLLAMLDTQKQCDKAHEMRLESIAL